ncbi:hypothetical protein SAMN06297251_11338 [Fulvimarina manganoxydans]|uniref:Copper binding protein CusF n=1 Tax=Fulvimarina manganoxydans TaxID=937218 RepID=A0A1W2D850_9HYPH|nr:hypothetical protein SAMN06297251_11338 [Fulvimarina manganoxydans]
MTRRFTGRRAVLLALALLVGGAGSSSAQTRDASAAASIAVSPRDDGLTLIGKAHALTNAEGQARMIVTKTGLSGRVSTTQGGEFALAAGESADVATVGLSTSPGDRLTVDLTLTSGERVLSTSRLTIDE